MSSRFDAPWSPLLKVVSLICTLGVTAVFWLLPYGPIPSWIKPVLLVVPVVLLGVCALFTVRRYEVDDGVLSVQRLFWKTRVPLAMLTGAELRAEGFGRALRICGNGGLYSFTGWYYTRGLGAFRAFATRTKDAVLLRFADRKPILVTPADPAAFLAVLRERHLLPA
jgi:hypothetical protein